MGQNRFSGLEEVLGYSFCDVENLQLALTHSSYANERGSVFAHNERLEYLGDAVLGLVIAELLYLRFGKLREGELTRMRSGLVSEPALARVARELSLSSYICLGKGEQSQGGLERESILSDALEAVFAAVFLDGGYEAAKKCITQHFSRHLTTTLSDQRIKDPKTRLQELMHKHDWSHPVYNQIGHSGPAHDRDFEVSLELPQGTVVTATGKSLKKAEQNVAKKALMFLDSSLAKKTGGKPF